jgi:5-methylcytosine-specific restriction enzyme subunit McrC
MKKNRIRVFEHQTVRSGKDQILTEKQFESLSRYGYQTKEYFYKVGNKRITFKQYVGIIKVGNLEIEVLPTLIIPTYCLKVILLFPTL